MGGLVAKTLSDETKQKLSEALKRAYAEGRKQPVQSGHRKGIPHTEETKAKIREARAKQTIWNKGIKTGPRPEAVREKISRSTKGRESTIPMEKREAWRQAISEGKKGHVQSEETRQRRGASLRKAYAEGRKTVKAESGYGLGGYYDSPFQGRVWLRSSSEFQRADELDAAGLVWFYEVKRYSVQMDQPTTYTPDFWVVPNVDRKDVPSDALAFLQALPVSAVQVEDVKGWWKPSHKTFPKIQAFREQYPDIQFSIVLREGRQ